MSEVLGYIIRKSIKYVHEEAVRFGDNPVLLAELGDWRLLNVNVGVEQNLARHVLSM